MLSGWGQGLRARLPGLDPGSPTPTSLTVGVGCPVSLSVLWEVEVVTWNPFEI